MASTHILISLLLQIGIIILSQNFHIKCATLSKFPAILVFGDSLVDTGNNNFISTIVKANHIPYGYSFPNHVPTGRFSNGKLISDFISSSLGIKDLVPPFLNPNISNNELKSGACFASAGSGYDEMTTIMSNVIPVLKQKDYFKQYVEKLKSVVGKQDADGIISNALVFLVAGSNDYLLNFYVSPTRRAQFGPGGFQDFLQQRIHDFVKELYDLGCRNFLIAGIPPLADAFSYNRNLEALLPKMKASLPGTKFVYADLATPITDLTINPTKYGLLVTNIPCCVYEVGNCSPFSVVCPNPNQYLRWDSVHFSEAAYKVMAHYLLDNAIPQFFKS